MMASKNYIIYKIVCDDLPDFIYVGSTGDFNYRKRKHQTNSKDENCKAYNYKLYTTIRENGEWENWRMIQIHQMQNVTKREAEAIEEDYRVELKANLNTNRAYRFPEVSKELKAIGFKNWYDSDKGKKNYVARKEHKVEYKKEWYKANKERQAATAGTHYVCNCGKEITRGSKSKHEKTQFHLNYIKEQN